MKAHLPFIPYPLPFTLYPYSEPLRDAANQAHGVAGDEQLLVGGDDVDGEARAVAADEPLAPRGRRLVRRRVQPDAHPAQALADARAHLRRVLADAAREDQRVRAPHRRQIRADVLAHAVTKNL